MADTSNRNISVEEKEVDSKKDDGNADNIINEKTTVREQQVEQEEEEQEDIDDDEYIEFKTEMDDLLKELNKKGDYLTDFNVEFEKLIKSMASSHENELRVERKCRKLTSEISKVK